MDNESAVNKQELFEYAKKHEWLLLMSNEESKPDRKIYFYWITPHGKGVMTYFNEQGKLKGWDCE